MVIVNKKRDEDAAKLEASPDNEKRRDTKQRQKKNKQGNKAVPMKEYNQNGSSQVSFIFIIANLKN